MPEHFVLTDAGLMPAACSSLRLPVLQPDIFASAPEAQAAIPSEPSNSDSKVFDLRAVAREVQALGALHLDKKHDTKSFKSNQLQQLGIKLPKQQRLGAKIGVASLHKAKRREEKQEQELIDTGMKSLRGRSKRKAASQKSRKDKGLNEAQGFKSGVMRVKSNAMKASGMKKQGQKQKLGKGRGKSRK